VIRVRLPGQLAGIGVGLPDRSTSPRLSSGKPVGAVRVTVSQLGLKVPKKNSLSFRIGPPREAPMSAVWVPVVLTVPFGESSCLKLACRAGDCR